MTTYASICLSQTMHQRSFDDKCGIMDSTLNPAGAPY
eukprot:CAMPEP_0171320738 /NCGR_PEP_ID=MMETSP0816-20121228/106640_1 /TAXON_ID=420281 /ORGANISM="Proboscia inermis, Strain CCAP1064/1" /LENGTH=36 /DNA_ID= /DNA_START= /DNA_END= /DNA_ORIENTATION=